MQSSQPPGYKQTFSFHLSVLCLFVSGRRGYDNWLVRAALKTDLATIEVTKTVNALHQTGKSGNFEGHKGKNGDYNMHLLGAFDPSLGKSWKTNYYTPHQWRV